MMMWTAPAIIAIAGATGACGLAPRSDYAEGAQITRAYPVNYVRMASCAFGLLDAHYSGRVMKTDFLDRRSIRLSHNIDSMRVWTIDLTAEGPNATRASMDIPPNIGRVQPESILEKIEPCTQSR